MPDFNIIPEIGRIDTGDPARQYTPIEQLAITGSVFRGLPLPGLDKGLLVERRYGIDANFSSEFGLVLVSAVAEPRPILRSAGESSVDGFLLEATAAASNACRKVLERKILGSYSKSTETNREGFRERREVLARHILEIGLRPGDIDPSDTAILPEIASFAVSPELGARDMEPFHVFVNALLDRLQNIRAQDDYARA